LEKFKKAGKEYYVEVCERSERTEIIWRKAEIWKLCGSKKEFARGKHLVILGKDSDVYISLNCEETERWEEEQLWDKW